MPVSAGYGEVNATQPGLYSSVGKKCRKRGAGNLQTGFGPRPTPGEIWGRFY
jgi:hypothetical protein